jgi:hypothetical protein
MLTSWWLPSTDVIASWRPVGVRHTLAVAVTVTVTVSVGDVDDAVADEVALLLADVVAVGVAVLDALDLACAAHRVR